MSDCEGNGFGFSLIEGLAGTGRIVGMQPYLLTSGYVKMHP
jgi:hypothetical protein